MVEKTKVQNKFFGKLEFSVLTYKHGSEVVYDFDDLRHRDIGANVNGKMMFLFKIKGGYNCIQIKLLLLLRC